MANLLLEQELKEKVSEILGEEPSDLWLNVAWEILEGLLGYKLDLDTRVDRKEGNGKDVTYLTNRPVKEIKTIKINNFNREVSEFEVYKEIGIRNKLGCFEVGIGQCFPMIKMGSYTVTDNVEVSYVAGYTAEDFPSDLIFAICYIISSKKQMSSDAGTLSSYKISDISYAWRSQEEVNSIIESYIRSYRNG